jgi:DNA-binding NarL/FixJ family response regulator
MDPPMTNPTPIRVLLADDHTILLDGLSMVLNQYPNIEVVGVANDGLEVLRQLHEIKVDVALIDVQMPTMDGFQTANAIRDNFPNVKILVLSMHNDRPYIERMYQIGASGYLLKTASIDEILAAIEKVHRGELHFSNDVILTVLNYNRNQQSSIVKLTRREHQVIELIAKEHSNVEIAEILKLSVETINTYRKNLLKKTGVKNTAGLVRYAINQGIVTTDR